MNKKYSYGLLLASLMFLSFANFGLSITSSSEWCVSEDDMYYCVWTSHPLYTKATAEKPLYERVTVASIQLARAVHDPNAWFEYSVNVTGEAWNGKAWDPISPGQETQLTMWNDTGDVWFSGGLFFGAPCLAPLDLSQTLRKDVILQNSKIIWGIAPLPTVTVDNSVTPNIWTFTNGTETLKVSYEDNGFITYYYLNGLKGLYECTLTVVQPELPGPDIPGYPMIFFGILSVSSIIILAKKARTNRI